MKETTIAFVTFFMTFFLLIQIKIIGRIRKLRMIRRKMIEIEYYQKSTGEILCDCINCFCCSSETRYCRSEAYDIIEEEFEEDLFEFRHKARMEKRYKERKRKQSSLDLTLEKEKSKIIKLVDDSEKTSIWWVSSTTNIPKEDIVEILKYEPGYLIVDDYIYNQRKMTKEEILTVKEKIAGWKMCPNCENPVEKESEYCPNCGTSLLKKSKKGQ